MNTSLRHVLRRRWLRELLVVALLFKALIPAGYMADVDSDGLPTLKLCSSALWSPSGPASGGDAPGSDPQDDANDHAMHGVCPQAVLLLPAVAPPSWVVALPMQDTGARAYPDSDSLQNYRSPTPRSRLPRGPPALA